ncbi:MAG: efflux RND transporter periplasmic adaptor subunit [Acidobacteria bacterium]|nr:efflux RND transporter periplasmic adaptor subunit [Acidobacteriota bacterium]
MKNLKNIALIALSALVLIMWVSWPGPKTSPATMTQAKVSVWTCPMHPEIRRNKPGTCPKCGMDLVEAHDDEEGGSWSLALSEQAQKLAEIRTQPVERRFAPKIVRLVGKVTYDEKKVSSIAARSTGRIERLYVDYTGVQVRAGDHMVDLYSPDLVAAQQELLQASKTLGAGASTIQGFSEQRRNAAREKLSLLGLNSDQIEAIERGEFSNRLTLYAPIGGVVIAKHVREGVYVNTGDPIYTVADLSRVWIQLEAYESDLAWLHFGQDVRFAVEAFPGRAFHGRIVFIDPLLNPETRTVRLRIDLPNPENLLKPDMFVRAEVDARISSNGKVLDPSLKGKWISPMHPEIVKDGPGQCDVCGMDLVPAESMGFETNPINEAPLVIPASAPLITGETAVVYVAVGSGQYEGRQIVLGPRSGNDYIVLSGLEEGEQVVVQGAFKIDSELQIRLKNSMLYPPKTQPEISQPAQVPSIIPGQMAPAQWDKWIHTYLAWSQALAADDLEKAQSAALQLKQYVMQSNPPPPALMESLASLQTGTELDSLRNVFGSASEAIFSLVQAWGSAGHTDLGWFHCPMAFQNQGANWIQPGDTVANPYFGAAMLRCGSKVSDVPAGGGHE